MPYRGRVRGEPSRSLPPSAFVAFIQNHDQVGNRAFGDRLSSFCPRRSGARGGRYLPATAAGADVVHGRGMGRSAGLPLLRDFGSELAEAVCKGRREEFARFPEFQDPARRERIPDPTAEATFASAKLRWADITHSEHAGWLSWYRMVIGVRHTEIVPRLAGIRACGRYEVLAEGAVVVRWSIGGGRTLTLAANLSGAPVSGFPALSGQVIWREGDPGEGEFAPWSVRWTLEESPGGGALDELTERMGIEPEFRKRCRLYARVPRQSTACLPP